MRRAYIAITAFVVAFVLFSVFVPFINVYPWPECPSNGALCICFPISGYTSVSYKYLHFGGVYDSYSYQFMISSNTVHVQC